jgi:spermidine/putrescine transport system permease protein
LLAYLAAAYVFIFLPVAVLVAFSFQDGRLPVPPFAGHAGLVRARAGRPRPDGGAGKFGAGGGGSSAVALVLGFLAAHGLARVRLPGSAPDARLLIAPMTVSYADHRAGAVADVSTASGHPAHRF